MTVERIKSLEEQVKLLTQRLTDVETHMHKRKTDRTKGIRGLSESGQELMHKVVDAIENPTQPFLIECDLFTSADLMEMVRSLFPEHLDLISRIDNKAPKYLGRCLSVSGRYESLPASTYLKFDPEQDEPEEVPTVQKFANVQYTATKTVKRGKQIFRRVWVLRNLDKYKHMGPSELYTEYRRQLYRAGHAQQQALAAQVPSFM